MSFKICVTHKEFNVYGNVSFDELFSIINFAGNLGFTKFPHDEPSTFLFELVKDNEKLDVE